ncbi:MAG TPA: hypothetical protein VMD29_13015 [Terracidiphilus sp.]|nr:hypothetical protein [Terracidiphilus sp.]
MTALAMEHPYSHEIHYFRDADQPPKTANLGPDRLNERFGLLSASEAIKDKDSCRPISIPGQG